MKRIRQELCQFICDQTPEESYEIIHLSLSQNHPMRKLWDEDSLKKLMEKRKKSCDSFIKEAKEIFIRIIKHSPYFPELKEGDEQKKQDAGLSLFNNILQYRQLEVEEGKDFCSNPPAYLFFTDKFSKFINLEQIKYLRELDAKNEYYELENKSSFIRNPILTQSFLKQRNIYLNDLKKPLTPIKFNFILGKILICNQALKILLHPTQKVSPVLLET